MDTQDYTEIDRVKACDAAILVKAAATRARNKPLLTKPHVTPARKRLWCNDSRGDLLRALTKAWLDLDRLRDRLK